MQGDTAPRAAQLDSHGYLHVAGPFHTTHEANRIARAVVQPCWSRRSPIPLSVLADFVVPPPEAGESRDFQTLHFDFGLPLDPKVTHDVAFYTALYVPIDVVRVAAVTRLVPLAALLGQRSWAPIEELVERLTSYGRTHGAFDDAGGYVEGILARLIEAAAAEFPPFLPSVKTEPGFLCGLEFDSLGGELSFFERHGLQIHDVEIAVALQPGELLVFDNLKMAHGRRGRRQPGELRQRVFGHALRPALQRELRDSILKDFCSEQPRVAV